MEEKKFSKFFVASLKRTAQNVYPLVRQRNKLQKQIEEAQEELNSINIQLDAYQAPIKEQTDGYTTDDLISREVIDTGKTDKNGKTTDSFVTPNIYFSTEYCYYVDGEDVSDGDVILKPNSSETYTVHETAKLEGIYCINKGYAVFRQIDVIYQNEEYSIIRSGTDYGISLYDHIALDGSTITENALINE